MSLGVAYEYGRSSTRKIVRWNEKTLSEVVTFAPLLELTTYVKETGEFLDNKFVQIGNQEYTKEIDAFLASQNYPQ